MDTKRTKEASEWFYSTVYREEPIQPRAEAVQSGEARSDLPQKEMLQEKTPRPKPPKLIVPAAIKAARQLEKRQPNEWLSREEIFINQGKLLENFEDDYPGISTVTRYFPTYQAFSDRELRWYFTWRAKLRRGELEKTSLSFAFLYIYELLNQIGVRDPQDGFRKLNAFAADYGRLDDKILPYLNRWIVDYAVYYELPPELLKDILPLEQDKYVQVFVQMPEYDDSQLIQALTALAPKWLGRSKFYRQNRQDMDTVLARVLRGIYSYCQHKNKKTMAEQFFGKWEKQPTWMFESAVMLNKRKITAHDYVMSPVRVYFCDGRIWWVKQYEFVQKGSQKLEDLVKTVDCEMRLAFQDLEPVQSAVDTKWMRKIIRDEVDSLVEKKEAERRRIREAEAKKLHLDNARLEKIRRDAAITQEKLTVEEERELPDAQPEQSPPPPAAQPAEEGTVLSGPECHLVRSLLYGGDLNWVSAEGYILSVLVDGVNEKLYDTFQDTVLEEPLQVVADYMEELKEMVHP